MKINNNMSIKILNSTNDFKNNFKIYEYDCKELSLNNFDELKQYYCLKHNKKIDDILFIYNGKYIKSTDSLDIFLENKQCIISVDISNSEFVNSSTSTSLPYPNNLPLPLSQNNLMNPQNNPLLSLFSNLLNTSLVPPSNTQNSSDSNEQTTGISSSEISTLDNSSGTTVIEDNDSQTDLDEESNNNSNEALINNFANILSQITPPQPVSNVNYDDEISQLEAIGFLDRGLNIEALMVSNGNVEQAANYLFERQTW